jgi:integrase
MKTAKLIFFLRKDKMNKTTLECPIEARITVAGKRAKFSINRKITYERWKSSNRLIKARKPEDKELLNFIESIKYRIQCLEREFIEANEIITAERLRDAYNGKEVSSKQNTKTVIKVFENHNKQFAALVKSEVNAKGTLDRYEQALTHVKDFMKWQYQKDDFNLCDLKSSFIKDFDFYLRTERRCGNNSTVKYVRNFRKIIKHAVIDELIDADPFAAYQGKIIKVTRQYLTPEEIYMIEKKNFLVERLNVVKDIFIFSVYTGYAYCEVKKLTPQDLVEHSDGEKWIFTTRTKTKVPENMMLFPEAVEILKKYKNHPLCIKNNRLLPVPSNQRVNGYLKEIADVCGIDKNLTFHTARHSFATSIMLANGASYETTSDVIGHSSVKQTQHYAKMMNPRVSSECKKVKGQLAKRKRKWKELNEPQQSNSSN